ncbi:NAD-dependent epimerase/dehydratase family protein [Actinoplanes awajinensis]|uniref:Epimerase n=1 Tax=Actinoplanes awajinensis subsp. mycoplanecinus TaxID=135947 RepID=A0A0X3UTT1_9ACTN|nr:NAD-dependent epimerase/dehydratase family protein [Actinoplanes awajinensis]KUL35920.1 epimerase [Actinoplanes awajinensis subsp. mycoplanecinus]
MRVVIVGATGNAGTALLRRLRNEPGVEVIGVARRLPEDGSPHAGLEWHSVDIGRDDAQARLTQIFAGVDAVVNLAWQIQPSHDARQLYRTNVLGSRTVFRAALRAGVGTLVQASSVGVYAPGPKWAYVKETWLRTGIPESSYSRHKALVERMLDEIESDHPTLRVVRLRPGLIFQRDAGTETGPLVPARLLRYGRVPVLPAHPGLRLQAVHADDLADAYLRVLRADVRGAFNIAAGPVLDPAALARAFHGVAVPVPGFALEGAAALSWLLRLQPVDRGWVRLALKAPLMCCDRAAEQLGWRPRTNAVSALHEAVAGLTERAGRAGQARRAGRPAGGPGWLSGVSRKV